MCQGYRIAIFKRAKNLQADGKKQLITINFSRRIQTLCDQLQLKLQAIQGCYADLAETAATSETSSIDCLEEILKAENAMRQRRSRHTLAKLAGFPAIKTLEEYDFDFATGAPRQRLLDLARLAFLERKVNVGKIDHPA